jgi:hypothetical protein
VQTGWSNALVMMMACLRRFGRYDDFAARGVIMMVSAADGLNFAQ